MNEVITGGCFCGRIRYEIAGDPALQLLCFCKDCQRISGTAGYAGYMVDESIPIYDHDGNLIQTEGVYYMCRCGGSKNKPFCDGTHNKNNFNGQA